jgi:phosphatidylinositol alpha-1,6-mannosyltransferase
VLAAVTLHPTGGGVAAASRLFWRVMHEQWGERARLVALAGASRPAGAPGLARRLRFGAELAIAQAGGGTSWVFYSHLSLARVNRALPPQLRRPYAVFLHGIEAWRPLDAVQRAILEDAALVIANSAYTARRVAAAQPWMKPIEACELALPDDPSTAPAVMPRGMDMGPSAVLIVGRLDAAEQYKGHDQLLEAWPAIRAAVPAARLVVAGDGNDRPRLEQRARDLGVAASVIFTGFVDDAALTALYRHAAVFAMPSRNEGFGLVYLEAMAHQLPCVGSTADAARDIIEHGRTGFLVEQSAIAAISGHLIDVLTSPARRQALGAAGRARLEQRFTYAAFKTRFVGLLEAAFPEAADRRHVVGAPSGGKL